MKKKKTVDTIPMNPPKNNRDVTDERKKNDTIPINQKSSRYDSDIHKN